jgi:hypothetical protein
MHETPAFALVPRKSLDTLMLSLTGVLAFAALAIMGYIAWIVLTPMVFLEVEEPEWTIDDPDKVLAPMDEVYVNIHACKNTDLPSEIGRMIVGTVPGGVAKQVIPLPDVSEMFEHGCRHVNLSVATIPAGIRPGAYRVHVVTRYRFSALRNVEHVFTTEEFQVK